MPRSAVLLSGGLDSAVLLAAERAAGPGILPIHVRAGFAWEDAEAAVIADLLDGAPFLSGVEPVATLAVDLRDVYPDTHWALTGQAPAYHTPDEDVYLIGRNVTLISKAAVLCAGRGVSRLVLGPLAGNPFPDARPAFFEAMARAMALGLDHPLEIAAPLAALRKEDVIRLGLSLGVPLARTLSCMNPVGTRHCGRCSKCRERRDAYARTAVIDPTSYAADGP